MVAFIFSLILLVAGIIVGVILLFAKNWEGDSLAKFSAIPFTLGTILFVVLLLVSLLVTVPTGHTGIVVTFGNVEEETFDAGMHSKKPWQKVISVDNRVQKETVSLSCFSKDIQEVELKYTINYQLNKSNVQTIYKNIGTEYYDVIIKPNISECAKVIVAKYTAENLISTRDTLSSEIEVLLKEQLDNYNINVVSTAIEDIDFADEFTNAVEAKQVAAQNKLKAQTEQEQKTMETEQAAERSKIEAAAAAEVSKIQASADKDVAQIGADSAEYQGKKEAAIAMQRLAAINGWSVVNNGEVNQIVKPDGTAVSDEELKNGVEKLIEYYYVTAWNGILPEYYGGSGSISSIILGNN